LYTPRVATGPENAGFRQTASVASNPIPLPVEIVSDISTIASGGNIPQEGVWRPAYPTPETAETAAPSNVAAAPGAPIAEAAREVALNPDGSVQEPDSQNDPSTEQDSDEAPIVKSKSGHRRRVASSGGKTETYKVRGGDTLMKISFEKYGNIYRWREIYDTNKSKIANLNKLTAGTLLTIQGVEYIVIERNGTPYLIRRGDTLVKISKDVYSTPTEWKSIWKNNRQLIHDPNKIYAGFTLYYVPKQTDEAPRQVRQISTEKPALKPKAVETPSTGPETTTEPEARTVPGVNLAPASVSAPATTPAAPIAAPEAAPASPANPQVTAPAAEGGWTAAPATPMELPAQAPTAKP
jgi:nucleoid-associated protein YgaU